MLIEMMKSKIHRAIVTEACLDYIGSITIDSELMRAAGIFENEKIQICNVENGNRLETYVIPGEPNSGEICINGAAAHLVNPGDKVILITYCSVEISKAAEHKPTVVFVDDKNHITSIKGETASTIFE